MNLMIQYGSNRKGRIMEQKQDVFISFSFKDRETAEYVGKRLKEEYHISYWMCTRELVGGEHYKGAIVEAIKSSALVLMIQSANSLSSREVPKEVSVALDAHKPVIPFVLDDAELSGDLEYDLIGIHRVDARKPTLDERIEELAGQIYSMLKKEADTDDGWAARLLKTRLLSTATVVPKKIFLGRDDALEELRQGFVSGERVQFLYGIGGIGKTQIAKQYAKKYQADYDTVVFATYNGSVLELVVANAPFCLEPELQPYTLPDGTTESDTAFFARKLEKIKAVTDERTLIVIDNFDTDHDEYFSQLIGGRYHLLITTRSDYSKFYPTVKVDAIQSMDCLKEIFMQNYDGYDVEEDDPELETLIELVNRHTYTVELLAQHMENSGQTAAEMVEALKQEGISSLTEEVRGADLQTSTAYENLLKMFRLFTLSEEEKQILMILSFMPIDGINVRNFRQWAELDSCKNIKELETKSWLAKNGEGIALHPVIRDVIRHEIPVNYENCGSFLARFTDAIEDKKMWGEKLSGKLRYARIGRNIAARFPEIDKKTEDFYYFLQCLLSFDVDVPAAIELSVRLYDYYRAAYGENAFKTARAAFKCGWVYTRDVNTLKNVETAIPWLEEADRIFAQTEMHNTDEISRHTMNKRCLSKMYLAKFKFTGETAFYEKAKALAEETMALSKAHFKPGDFHYAKIAGDGMQLAEILLAGEEPHEALTVNEKAIELLIEHYGTAENSDMAYPYYVKAVALQALGEFAQALSVARESAEQYELYFGNRHPKIHELYLMMGDCAKALGDLAGAKEHYEKALKAAERIYAADAERVLEIKSRL